MAETSKMIRASSCPRGQMVLRVTKDLEGSEDHLVAGIEGEESRGIPMPPPLLLNDGTEAFEIEYQKQIETFRRKHGLTE